MDKIIQIKPRKLLIGSAGFITGYYLNSFAVFSISCIISMQYYWLKTTDEKEHGRFLIDIDKVIKTFEEDKQIPFGIKSAFFTGYATGIIYQYMYMWLILGGVASGLTIAYKYTPIELEKNTRHKLMEYPLARRYLFDTEKVEKIESRQWLYFI